MAEIHHAKALRLARFLTGTDKQALDTHWHIAKQRTEGNGIMALAASWRQQDKRLQVLFYLK